MDTDMILAAVCAAAAVTMAVYYIRCERRLRTVLFGSLTGLAALFILNRYGEAFGSALPLNALSLCGSAVLGVPFVIFLVLCR